VAVGRSYHDGRRNTCRIRVKWVLWSSGDGPRRHRPSVGPRPVPPASCRWCGGATISAIRCAGPAS